MNRSLTIFFFGMVIACVCIPAAVQAKGVSIYQKKDDFSGITMYFTDEEQPKLEGGSFLSGRYVDINFSAISPMDDPRVAYDLNIDATLEDWMFISSGDSLVLKADDQTVTLHGRGSIDNREVLSGQVEESASYSFSLDTLKKLASAKAIQFRVYGDKGQITGTFTDKMMDELRYFAEQAPGLIKDNGVAAAAPEPVSTAINSAQSPQKFGARFVALPDVMADAMKLPRAHGVWLLGLTPDLPAAKSGLKVGDVILSFDGKNTDAPEVLQAAVAAHAAGTLAAVLVITPGSAVRTLIVSM